MEQEGRPILKINPAIVHRNGRCCWRERNKKGTAVELQPQVEFDLTAEAVYFTRLARAGD